uniref:transmembrane protease serine 5-like n=1 Tax=Podarcis muralis TaxID=64176 RepID=UPI0010A031BF|nr:transmembrane protease serine 5-like [Podarcis muralis]
MVQSHNPGPSSEAKGEERSRASKGNVPSKTFLVNSCTVQRCLLFLGSFGLLIGTTIGVWFLVKQLQKPLPLQGSSPLQDPEAALTRCRETMEEGEKDQDTLAGDAGSKKVFFRINRNNFLLEVQAEGQSNWFLVCHENWDVSLGMQICRWLGHARLTHHKGVNLTDVKLNTTQEFAQILPNWKRNIKDKWQMRSRCPSGRIVALKCSECGSKAPQTMERKDPSPGHWPWQVTLYHEANHFCAGSMVSEEWIVTAAHCMHKLSGWVAFAGLEDHTSVKEQVEAAVEKAVPHPNYSSRSPDYDIAMLKLKEPLRFSGEPCQQPVTLGHLPITKDPDLQRELYTVAKGGNWNSYARARQGLRGMGQITPAEILCGLDRCSEMLEIVSVHIQSKFWSCGRESPRRTAPAQRSMQGLAEQAARFGGSSWAS